MQTRFTVLQDMGNSSPKKSTSSHNNKNMGDDPWDGIKKRMGSGREKRCVVTSLGYMEKSKKSYVRENVLTFPSNLSKLVL